MKERERVLRYHYQYHYQITLEEYDAMFAEQFGLCAICGKPPKDGKPLHVDHCHKSNVVRGLLCMRCNHMLGQAKDDIPTLKRAIKYLTKHAS